jgi:hypothetical protein
MTEETTRSLDEESAPRAPQVLVVFDGDTPARHALPPRGDLVLGRGDDASLRVDNASVSRRHASFVVGEDGEVTVTDLGSHNGTRVGGVAIAPSVALPVHAGDVVECGGVLVLLARADRAASSASQRSLVVSDDARWFRRDGGDIVNLGRRGALLLLLLALVERRLSAPGTALDVDAMFAAGWPDERIARESATARVYTSVQRLRGLGVGDLLVTRGDGYLLDPEADVRRG